MENALVRGIGRAEDCPGFGMSVTKSCWELIASIRRVSEMENGRRAIDKKTAKCLANVLNTIYKVFL
ncbi:hypothetical protein QUF80_13265 [Desulfococcaceae bacterium HSG8]|nr:hypothetical protein [Desulfococcaceae bacterium HSG8]